MMCKFSHSDYKRCCLAIIALFAVLVFNPAIQAAELIGTATIIDGDTVKLNDQTVHFYGVDAPEVGQQCIIYQLEWPCGQRSIVALARFIDGKPIRCEIINKPNVPTSATANARCFNFENLNLSAAIIGAGMAVPLLSETNKYLSSEKHAQLQRAGIWSGRFITPNDWRDGKRFRPLGRPFKRNKLKE